MVGRRSGRKELDIRDVKYRDVAPCEFSELCVFLFLMLTASIFSARVHVALKDIQISDL